MKTIEISFGSGLAWPFTETVDIEDYATFQDALDALVNKAELEENEGYFATQDEVDSGDIGYDEYIKAGNHGRYLRHYGMLTFKEIEKEDDELCHEQALTLS